jgi:hypothetical protein
MQFRKLALVQVMSGEVRAARLVPTPWLCAKRMPCARSKATRRMTDGKSHLLVLLVSLEKRRRSQRGQHTICMREGRVYRVVDFVKERYHSTVARASHRIPIR